MSINEDGWILGEDFKGFLVFEDAKELRIGNIVNHIGYDFYEDDIFPDGTYDETIVDIEVIMFLEGEMGWYTKSGFSPIKIDLEYAKRMGFKYNEYDGFRMYLEYNKVIYNYFLDTEKCSVNINGEMIFIKYVHQLQNLYFSLTGNEIEIK